MSVKIKRRDFLSIGKPLKIAFPLKSLTVSAIIFCFFSTAFPQMEKRIEEIRKIYQEVNKKVAECEENGDTSTTFLTEVFVNKNNGSYPAVGIYKTTAKFYYTFGDREKNPYPDRLMKIVLATNRSAMTENYEYLFNSAGQLIFYLGKKDETEIRVYFETEKPFKILHGEKNVKITDKSEIERVKAILSLKQKLVGIFQSTQNF